MTHMAQHRLRAHERLSDVAALHGVSLQDIVAANSQKPTRRLGDGRVVFQTLDEGEDIALPGRLGVPQYGKVDPGAGKQDPGGQGAGICPPGQMLVGKTRRDAQCLVHVPGTLYTIKEYVP